MFLSSVSEVPPSNYVTSEQVENEIEIDDNNHHHRCSKPRPFSTSAIPTRQSLEMGRDAQTDENVDDEISMAQCRTKEMKQNMSRRSQIDENQGENSGLSKQTMVIGNKKQQTIQRKYLIEGNDNNGVKTPKESYTKKKFNRPKKGKIKSSISRSNSNEDEDDRLSVRTKNTTKIKVPSKQSMLDDQKPKEGSSLDTAASNSSNLCNLKRHATSTLYDTIVPTKSEVTDNIKSRKATKSTENSYYDTVHTDEGRSEETAIYSLDSYYSASRIPLRSISYFAAQNLSPSPILHSSHVSSTSHSHKNKDDGDSHYYRMINGTTRSAISNCSHAESVSAEGLRSDSNKEHVSEKQQRTEDTNVETDTENEAEEEETEEEEEKERQKEQEEEGKVRLLQSRSASSPSESQPVPITSTSRQSKKDEELERNRRRKKLRFRWYFLYTIIRNYHLLDLRKGIQGRLARWHSQRDVLTDEKRASDVIPKDEQETTTSIPESRLVTTLARLLI